MARNKTETDNESHAYTEEDAPKLPALSATADEHARNSLAINKQFDLVEYDRRRVISEARFYMNHAVESYLELGKRLIQMKENEPHGEWLDCLDILKMSPRVAQRTMQATLKISNASSPTYFAEKVSNKSKMFELLIFDDEEIKELSEGKSVAGLTLDDVECMSASELRAAIRKTRADTKETLGIKEQIIAAKDKKLNELDQEVLRLKANKAAEPEPAPVFKPVGTDELEVIQKLTRDINAKIGAELHIAIDNLYKAFGGAGNVSRPMQLAAAQSFGLLITTCDSVAEYFYITPELDLERAAQDPVIADYNEFTAWQANGGADELTPEIEAFNQRMAAANAEPVGEQFSDWEAQGSDTKQLFDLDE